MRWSRQFFAGFTLLELCIVVAVLSILIMSAVPTYTASITAARRAEGKMALLALAQGLEHYFVIFNTYEKASIATHNVTEVFPTHQTQHGWYELRIVQQDATSYLIEAVPQASQALHDKACGSLRYDGFGVRSVTGTGALDPCW